MTEIIFTVYGKAEPQGSARAFMRPGGRYPVVTSDNPKLKAWRREVAKAAEAARYDDPFAGPVRVVAAFYLPRPKALRYDKAHITRPDSDKLLRGILDSLSGVVYRDDGQVTQAKAIKAYAAAGEKPHAVIVVTPLTEKGLLL